MVVLHLFLAVFLGVPILLLLLWLKEFFKYEKYLRRFKGPNVVPIVGNLLEFNTSSALLPGFLKYQLKYNGNFKIYLGFEPYLIVCEPKLAEFLLSSATILRKTRPYDFFCNWLGNGILTSTGDQTWKQHVICETTMGIVINAQKNPASKYVKSVASICKIVIERILTATQQYDFTYQFTDNYRNEKEAVAIIHSHTNSVIKRRKAEMSKGCGETEDIKRGKSLLDLLLKYNADNNNSFTDEELREEVDTVMVAGYETTATALQFILYCLSNHPDLQTRAYEEVMAILEGDKTKDPTYHDLLRMKYLDMVIKESLRLYPPVPLIGRLIEQNVEFDGGILPKGLSLLINVSGMHRDPNAFENPDQFNPDRFDSANEDKKSKFQYVPFSVGPRNCLGQKFAMLEMKAALTKVLKNFEIVAPIPKHEVQLASQCTLKSKNGVYVHIRHRT